MEAVRGDERKQGSTDHCRRNQGSCDKRGEIKQQSFHRKPCFKAGGIALWWLLARLLPTVAFNCSYDWHVVITWYVSTC